MTAPGLYLAFEPRTERRLARQFVTELRSAPRPVALAAVSDGNATKGWQAAAMLDARLDGCAAMLVLVGPETDRSRGVEAEVAAARRLGLAVAGLYVGTAQPGIKLPRGLTPSDMLAWDWGSIDRALGRLAAAGRAATANRPRPAG